MGLRLQWKDKGKNGKPIRGSMIYLRAAIAGSLRLNVSIRGCHLKRSETRAIAELRCSHGELHKKPHITFPALMGPPDPDRYGSCCCSTVPRISLHCTPSPKRKPQSNPFTTELSGCAINLYVAQNVREIRKATAK